MTDREREEMAALPFDEKQYFEQIGVVGGHRARRATPTLERRWARPTFDISGLWSGYQGEGAKTVLPASAGAKFSFRLVPNQDPAKITAGLKRRLAELCPPGVELRTDRPPRRAGRAGAAGQPLRRGGGPGDSSTPSAAGPSSPAREARSPSSPPSTSSSRPTRCCWAGARTTTTRHSPNEKFSLADFHRGIKASAKLWEELTK